MVVKSCPFPAPTRSLPFPSAVATNSRAGCSTAPWLGARCRSRICSYSFNHSVPQTKHQCSPNLICPTKKTVPVDCPFPELTDEEFLGTSAFSSSHHLTLLVSLSVVATTSKEFIIYTSARQRLFLLLIQVLQLPARYL